MVNSAYATVCDALSELVSRDAAAGAVDAVLEAAGADPRAVSAGELRALLPAVLGRLGPSAEAAAREADRRLVALEGALEGGNPAARPLPPHVLEGVEALRAELAPHARHPAARRLAETLERLPDTADPVDALNAMWAELAALRPEFSRPARAGRWRPPPRIPPREEQERLLGRFALEEGVRGLVLCDRTGAMHTARLASTRPEDLAAVAAATTLLLEGKRPFAVFCCALPGSVVFIAPVGDLVLTVLAEASVNVGRVLAELRLMGEEG